MQNSEYIQIDHNSRIPKYKQIVDSILGNIKIGNLELGEKIPSINELSEECLLSRDTVEKAYSILKERRVITSVRGKGYYISKIDLTVKNKILFLINKASSYKIRIYNSFVKTLGENAKIDLYIYHCEPKVFVDILRDKTNLYDYYVIMPHFRGENQEHIGCNDEALKLIGTIDPKKVIIMDRDLKFFPSTKTIGRVFQDFTEDIFNALNEGVTKLKNYNKIVLAYPNKSFYPYPKGIVTGFKRFCIHNNFDYEVIDKIYDNMEIQINDLYILIEESDLVSLVKQSRDLKLSLGKDVGVISYNDTPLKELLGITVISTNFKKMGASAAKMIINKKNVTIKNEFNFIDRNSL